MNERAAAVAAFQALTGHVFSDGELLERALTHSSVGDGARQVRHNERLEFLGDRVLNLLAAERLLHRFPDAREGELSPRLAQLVSGQTCARVARRLGLGPALRLSPGETRSGGRDKDGILGDAMEAVMAAHFLDGGLDCARRLFDLGWAEELDAPAAAGGAQDPKTRLQVWAQGRGLPLPAYRVVSRQGPDHEPNFLVAVEVKGLEPVQGRGRSRQMAEKAAAAALLERHEGRG